VAGGCTPWVVAWLLPARGMLVGAGLAAGTIAPLDTTAGAGDATAMEAFLAFRSACLRCNSATSSVISPGFVCICPFPGAGLAAACMPVRALGTILAEAELDSACGRTLGLSSASLSSVIRRTVPPAGDSEGLSATMLSGAGRRA
jgi:hypothetical protein